MCSTKCYLDRYCSCNSSKRNVLVAIQIKTFGSSLIRNRSDGRVCCVSSSPCQRPSPLLRNANSIIYWITYSSVPFKHDYARHRLAVSMNIYRQTIVNSARGAWLWLVCYKLYMTHRDDHIHGRHYKFIQVHALYYITLPVVRVTYRMMICDAMIQLANTTLSSTQPWSYIVVRFIICPCATSVHSRNLVNMSTQAAPFRLEGITS